MTPTGSIYDLPSAPESPRVREGDVEDIFIRKLVDLKYDYRTDICNRAALERNFREKFEACAGTTSATTCCPSSSCANR